MTWRSPPSNKHFAYKRGRDSRRPKFLRQTTSAVSKWGAGGGDNPNGSSGAPASLPLIFMTGRIMARRHRLTFRGCGDRRRMAPPLLSGRYRLCDGGEALARHSGGCGLSCLADRLELLAQCVDPIVDPKNWTTD